MNKINIPLNLNLLPSHIPNVRDKGHHMKVINVVLPAIGTTSKFIQTATFFQENNIPWENCMDLGGCMVHLHMPDLILQLRKNPVNQWFIIRPTDSRASAESQVIAFLEALQEAVDTLLAGDVVCNIIIDNYVPKGDIVLHSITPPRHARTYNFFVESDDHFLEVCKAIHTGQPSAATAPKSKIVMDMFLLPNVRAEDLKQVAGKFYFADIEVHFDRDVPYVSRKELITYIFAGDHCWNELSIPSITKSEAGLGKAAVTFALYHQLDFMSYMYKMPESGTARFTAAGNLLKIFNAIVDSCNMGLYPEVGGPKNFNEEAIQYHRFFASPFDPSIIFHIEPGEIKDPSGSMNMINTWIVNINNMADGSEAQVEVPSI